MGFQRIHVVKYAELLFGYWPKGRAAITISDFLNWVNASVIAPSKSVPDMALYFDAWAQGPSRLKLTTVLPFSIDNSPMLVTGGCLVLPVLTQTQSSFRRKFAQEIQGQSVPESTTPRLDFVLNIVAGALKSVNKSAFSLPVIFNSFDKTIIMSAGIIGGSINFLAEYATLSNTPLFLGKENPDIKSSLILAISTIASALNALLYAVSINGFAVHMGWEQESLMNKLFAREPVGSVLAILNLICAFSLFVSTLRTNIKLISTRFFDVGTSRKLNWAGKRTEEALSSIYKGSTSTSSMFALLNTIFAAVGMSVRKSLIASGCISFTAVTFNILAQHALLSSAGQESVELDGVERKLLSKQEMSDVSLVVSPKDGSASKKQPEGEDLKSTVCV